MQDDVGHQYDDYASGSNEQRLVLLYLPLIKRVVRQLAPQCNQVMDRDDMEQIGLMALLQALRSRDDGTEEFRFYLVSRIRGAILDELRRLDWRPRSVREQAFKLRDAVRKLTQTLGRDPSDLEVMRSLGLSEAEFAEFQQAEAFAAFQSLDALITDQMGGGEEDGMSTPSPENGIILRHSLAKVLSTLDEREQRVIQLYYVFDLSLKEIAAVLEVSEARICQIMKMALQRVKARLGQVVES